MKNNENRECHNFYSEDNNYVSKISFVNTKKKEIQKLTITWELCDPFFEVISCHGEILLNDFMNILAKNPEVRMEEIKLSNYHNIFHITNDITNYKFYSALYNASPNKFDMGWLKINEMMAGLQKIIDVPDESIKMVKSEQSRQYCEFIRKYNNKRECNRIVIEFPPEIEHVKISIEKK